MNKNTFWSIRKLVLTTLIAFLLVFSTGICIYAEEGVPLDETILTEEGTSETVNNAKVPDTVTDSETDTAENIFEEIYSVIELNADKIFSILAFIGTIVVSVGYKSGLLPLLRDALSKLKGAIDNVKEDGERNNQLTSDKITEISQSIDGINESLKKNSEELSRIEWQFEGYEELFRERESMKALIEGQIDMLYAIFMSSALPQYQKDEIGARIGEMREDLKSYGVKEN